MAVSRRLWTRDERDELRRLASAQKSASEIASTLQRSISSVASAARKMYIELSN